MTKKPAKKGRPSGYSDEVADEICRRMAEGESLKKIFEGDDIPAESTVRNWALDDREGFFPKYAHAREGR